MNSKEALARLTYCDNDMESEEKYYKTVKQDLDRLEKLEKEHEKLKERYKHRAETSNDLCKAVKQYEKAFEILVDKKVNILVLKYFIEKGDDVKTYNLYYTTKEKLTQEEYELLKEVLENDK